MKKRRAAKNASPLLSVLIVVFCLLVFFGSRYLDSQPAPAPAESAGLSAADGSLEVHFLDIGQGDSALLFCGEETMLIDGGKVKNNQKLISRLKELNVTHLEAVICSHPDEDHCGGSGRNGNGRVLLLSRQLAHEGIFRRRQICGRAGRLRHHPEARRHLLLRRRMC